MNPSLRICSKYCPQQPVLASQTGGLCLEEVPRLRGRLQCSQLSTKL